MGLTPKQKKLLDYIASYSEKNGFAPSQREIAEHFGFSSLGTVQNYLVRLQRDGYLESSWNAKRGVKVVSDENTLPLLGKVAAGHPLEAFSHHESVQVPPQMLKSGGEYFVLQVKGDSMIEDGILDGDYVIVRRQAVAHNGQTVVAFVDHGATIKRYYKKQDMVELRPANEAFKPIIVNAHHDFRIEGVMSGLIRKL